MSIEAIKLAIEWIEKQPAEITASKYDVNSRYAVLKALEEALAKQEQGEPVAYINIEKRRLEWAHDYMSWDTPIVVNLPRIPLYTTPQQRKPLTDEMEKQAQRHLGPHRRSAFRDGWRSAEASHGIKE